MGSLTWKPWALCRRVKRSCLAFWDWTLGERNIQVLVSSRQEAEGSRSRFCCSQGLWWGSWLRVRLSVQELVGGMSVAIAEGVWPV